MLDLVARYVDVSKYAIHTGGRRETREEGIARVMEMHATRYAAQMDQLRPEFQDVWDAMDRGEILGSQRARQFGGKPILSKNQRIYNCSLLHANRPRAFQEVFHLLLCGCGVGFSVQFRHVQKFPDVRRPTGPALTYQIPDTIEGWADAFGVLVSTYFDGDDQPFPEWAGTPVLFDGSLIRPAGAPISSGSKAPGPGPLLAALERARVRLDQVTSTRNRLEPIDVYDLLMYAADAVLAGGVRRSATIALFSPEDEDMARAKSYQGWREEHPQRQRSNNSAALLRDSTDWPTFCRLIDLARNWFDPGAYWMDHPDLVCNPCGEVACFPALDVPLVQLPKWAALLPPGSRSGIVVNEAEQFASLPGVQFCNLSTINGGRVRTVDDFVAAARRAAFLGTLQAGYTDFPYLGPVTEEITRQEALLGVSITGLADNPDVLFDPATLEAGAAEVGATNRRIAKIIGINEASRKTAIKPEGTGTLTLETLAKGVTPWHSKRGILHIRASVLETPFQFYASVNPHAVRDLAPSDPNAGNTKVLAFAFEAPEGASTKYDVDTWEMLRRVQLLRRHWVEPGTVPELCVRPWLRHNVSNTVDVLPEEWTPAARYVYDHRADFAGVTFARAEGGDKVFHLSPQVEVLTWDEQIEKYGIGVASSARCLVECSARFGVDPWFPLESRPVSWPVPDLATCWETLLFAADPEFDGPTRDDKTIDLAIEAAKDALFLAQFTELRELTREVDWAEMREEEDVIDFGAEAACSGGACLVDYGTFTPVPVGK